MHPDVTYINIPVCLMQPTAVLCNTVTLENTSLPLKVHFYCTVTALYGSNHHMFVTSAPQLEIQQLNFQLLQLFVLQKNVQKIFNEKKVKTQRSLSHPTVCCPSVFFSQLMRTARRTRQWPRLSCHCCVWINFISSQRERRDFISNFLWDGLNPSHRSTAQTQAQ